MTRLGILLLALSALFGLYTFVLYPGLLMVLGSVRRAPAVPAPSPDTAWPPVTITVPVYNEERQVAETVQSLLRLDYPRERLQILIVSDASSDGTDAIVQGFADQGVQLVRQAVRSGKTAAEALAARHITGDIVVNTDASIRIQPRSLKPLVAPFVDPRIGPGVGP